MRRRRLPLSLLLLCLALALAAAVAGSAARIPDATTPQLRIAAPTAPALHGRRTLVVQVADGAHLTTGTSLTRDGSFRTISVPAGQLDGVTKALGADARIASVEPDVIVPWADATYEANGFTNDPLASSEWGLQAIGWHASPKIGATPTIALLDSGLDVQHPDLAGATSDGRPKVAATYNAMDGTADVTDEVGHGTATSSLAAALTNNQEGIASVAPGSQVIMVKVGSIGGAKLSDIVRGLDYATTSGAKVINFSLATPAFSPAFRASVLRAVDHGIVVVAAVGNYGCASDGYGNPLQYPAGFPHVIAVAASDAQGSIACFSNYGDEVDLAAPGVDVPIAVPRGTEAGTLRSDAGYRTASGTSFSSPEVAGAAAVLLGLHPDWTPDQVRHALTSTAHDVLEHGWDDRSGAGILDLDAASKAPANQPLDDRGRGIDDDIEFAADLRPLRITAARKHSRGTLDATNDPVDVLPIRLTRGKTVRIVLQGAGSLAVHADLWSPNTRSIVSDGPRHERYHVSRGTDAHHASTITLQVPRSGRYWLSVTRSSGAGSWRLAASYVAAAR